MHVVLPVLGLFLPGLWATATHVTSRASDAREHVLAPKVFIISMFQPEGDAWYGISEFNVLEKNFTIPGFSPLYPDAHCTSDGDICQLITGESEINAATTISALVLSRRFDLKKTYFMVAGIAGGNPEQTTLGAVTFARYAIQVALQYEFDAREIPANFTTGYVPQGAYSPLQYPQTIYGTEVFEVNDALRHVAAGFARTAELNDSDTAVAYRANYAKTGAYAAGAAKPSVNLCDSATSDVYYSGNYLSLAFQSYSTLVSNGSAVYCSTLQEDNATLEVMLRATLAGLVDFGRIILMRTISDFDRPYNGESAIDNLFYVDQGGFEPALENIHLAGVKVVQGIVAGWDKTFLRGVAATNYIGDILDSLPQKAKPDFGLPSAFIGNQIVARAEGKAGGYWTRMKRPGGKRAAPLMPDRVPTMAA